MNGIRERESGTTLEPLFPRQGGLTAQLLRCFAPQPADAPRAGEEHCQVRAAAPRAGISISIRSPIQSRPGSGAEAVEVQA